jgi:hypothetical protein
MRLDPAQILIVAGEVLGCPVHEAVDACDLGALERACATQRHSPQEGFSPPALAALLIGLINEHPFRAGNDAIAVATIGVAASLDDRVLDLDDITPVIDQLHAGTSDANAVAEWLERAVDTHSKEEEMFERFTNLARKALAEAQVEAAGLGHNFIGTEHVLLGVARTAESVGAKALLQLGVSTDVLRSDLRGRIGPTGSTAQGERPFTPRAKRILEEAMRTAMGMGHNYIGTEHLLLACFKVRDGVACELLERQGATEVRATETVIRILTGESTSSTGALPTRAELLRSINAVLDENDRLKSENERLRALLRRHGIDPEAGTASA